MGRRRVYRWTDGPNPALVPTSPIPSTRVDGIGSVVGLDLSLRASAACAIPRGGLSFDEIYARNLRRVRHTLVGSGLSSSASDGDVVERAEGIAKALSDFCTEVNARAVYIEEYAFSQGLARAHQIGELGGIVKHFLRRLNGITAASVVASSARKLLLVKLPGPRGRPKGYVKKWVGHNVRRLGTRATAWTDDEVDAFVVANMGVMLDGGTPISYPGEDP